ncbi:helix-turn-helix transcriptional regulator [Crossiella sp. CA-258035]|uniref:helix-turn-helix domain-containing protein n=1 Tax=Crossiella sp. CA-258035 TaxID=2981138 RepID=UPI0024BC95D7|nr:helix-turn-helix transcriptional regulator [Crossiella sp. CA-258035]WHT21034.1 helix-turn-helix transcriptional regulator [Crossiella sp. CA-258035]
MSDSPLISKLDLGHLLQQGRERANMTAQEVVQALGFSASKISRIENGHTAPNATDLERLLDLYGVDEKDRPAIRELATAARRQDSRPRYASKLPPWFNRFRKLERAASSIMHFSGALIAGPLQTDKVALELFRANPEHTEEDVQSFLKARAARRSRLLEPGAPDAWFIFGEAAVRQEVGSIETRREQLDYLVKVSTQRNVTLQMIPFTAGAHRSLGFDFQILRIGDEYIVYTENLRNAAFVDSDEDKKAHLATFDSLKAVASSPKETRAFLERLRDSLA